MANIIPKLLEATAASERMDALCEFIEFWLGPRQPEFGEPAESLETRSLPLPLKRLYEFAGRWPDLDSKRSSEGRVPALGRQDHLATFGYLKVKRKSGKLVFLYENQGIWNCRTRAEGDDPPVWWYGPVVDADDNWLMRQRLVSRSLSKFLVTFVLQELTFGSRLCLCDDNLSARFDAERSAAKPVWTDGPYVYGIPHDYFLWGDVLVRSCQGHSYFAANSPAGLDFLSENQGPIDKFWIRIDEDWGLDVCSDGSAKIQQTQNGRDNGSVEAWAGAIEFRDVVKDLGSAAADTGHFDQYPQVYFRRQGQSGGVSAKYLDDRKLVVPLFRRCFECASGMSKDLESRFAQQFGRVTIDPRWLSSNVVELAQAIAAEKAFERLPILADALMHAGCNDEEILVHCRRGLRHASTCWVVDALLAHR